MTSKIEKNWFKYRSDYYFDNIININNLDPKNVKVDEKP